MPLYTSDFIFTSDNTLKKNIVIETDLNGKITGLFNLKDIKSNEIIYYKGIICPGFINVHCHLELSHLKNKIEKNISITNFIKSIIKLRNESSKDEILDKIKLTDSEMYSKGIVAVGDISNSDISFETKSNSKIKYINFIEVLGSNPDDTNNIIAESLKLIEKANNYNLKKIQITPHSLYSLSEDLFKEISKNTNKKLPISIHYFETKDEVELLTKGTGQFINFYNNLIKTKDFIVNKNTINFINNIFNKSKIILVHNTYLEKQDLQEINKTENINFCLCPKSNIYLENKIPNIDLFQEYSDKISIGTDSLASNEELNILEELKCIKNNYSNIFTSELLKWATINGANILGINKTYGSIEIGKNPKLVHIDNCSEKGEITSLSNSKLII